MSIVTTMELEECRILVQSEREAKTDDEEENIIYKNIDNVEYDAMLLALIDTML